MTHYIALIHKEADSGYGVSFPDVPGVIAVLTHEEDKRLRRTKDFVSPQKRWAEAQIRFPKNSPNAYHD